jgi:hypothetical protein
MKYFWNLRTKIEKTTDSPSGAYVHLKSFNMEDLKKIPQPPGVVGFFMGDENGGTGWNVKSADGSVETYYIEPPPEWQMNSGLLLREAPEAFRSYDAEHSWLVTWIEWIPSSARRQRSLCLVRSRLRADGSAPVEVEPTTRPD